MLEEKHLTIMHVLSWLGQLVGVFIFVKDQQHLGYADLSWLCRKEVPINYLSKHKRSLFFLFWQPIHPVTCLKNFIAAKIASVMLESHLTEACKGF